MGALHETDIKIQKWKFISRSNLFVACFYLTFNQHVAIGMTLFSDSRELRRNFAILYRPIQYFLAASASVPAHCLRFYQLLDMPANDDGSRAECENFEGVGEGDESVSLRCSERDRVLLVETLRPAEVSRKEVGLGLAGATRSSSSSLSNIRNVRPTD